MVARKKPAIADDVLEAMSDEDIKKAVQTFSFNIELCRSRLRSASAWGAIIQAHLFYDHILSKLLDDELSDPTQLKMDRMSFATKLDLCSSLGLIQAFERGFLRKVNGLRNDLAHNLEFALPRKTGAELKLLLPKDMRPLVDENTADKKETHLASVLLVFAILLDITRQHHAAGRLFEHRGRIKLQLAMAHAREVLDRGK